MYIGIGTVIIIIIILIILLCQEQVMPSSGMTPSTR